MEQYICPDCGANMGAFVEEGIIGTFLKLKCPRCSFELNKSEYDFIRDLGKHGHAENSQEQTKKAVVLSKNEVTGICKSGTSKGKKLVCQFKNGIDTQLISADVGPIHLHCSRKKRRHGKHCGRLTDLPQNHRSDVLRITPMSAPGLKTCAMQSFGAMRIGNQTTTRSLCGARKSCF